MLSKSKLVNILSVSLAAVLLALATTMTLIAIFFPDILGGGFDWSAYNPKYDASGELPGMGGNLDLNGNPLGGGNGGGNGGGDCSGDGSGSGNGLHGGDIDMSRVIFRVFSTEDNNSVYFRQGSYLNCKGNQWFEAQPFKSKNYPHIDTTYYAGQYILNSSYVYEKSVAIESLDGTLVMPYYPTSGIELPETVYPYEKENFNYTVNYVDYSDIIFPSYEYKEFIAEYEAYAYDTYLELDPETETYMKRVIDEQGFRRYSSRVIEDVAEYIRSAKKYNMNFDPKLEQEENIPVAFLQKYKSGVCRHFAASATMLYRALGIPARYTVGFLGHTVAEEWTDITAGRAHAWVEIFVDGFGWMPVDVTPSMENDAPPSELIPIEIKPVDIERMGDKNTVVSPSRIEGFEYYEARGYTYEAVFSGTQNGYGKTQTSIEDIKIYNEKGKDVTSHFKITAKEGTIHVYHSELTYFSNSETFVYCGETVSNNDFTDANMYYGNHTAYASFLSNPVDVGTVANVFVINVFNEYGQDITAHYKINYIYGEIEIIHAELQIKAMDAEKYYDGTPLECWGYEFIQNNLALGHYIDESVMKIVGSQTGRGRSENIIDINSIVIRDSYGRDVTKNYTIKTYAGQLRVR